MEITELYSLFLSAKKVFTDSRKANEGGLFFALKGENFDANNFALKAISDGADFAIVDRIDLKDRSKCIYVDDTLKTLQQLAHYHRKQLSIPVIGITGTNGKTTTKELIASVLSKQFNVLATKGNLNNHIGVPLTLLQLNQQHEIAVIEMGANHPGEIDFLCNIADPDLGIITNVGKAHLEGFGSFEGVKQTKSELYRYLFNMHKTGIFVNVSNSHLIQLLPKNSTLFTYGTENSNADLIGEVAATDKNLTAKVRFTKGWLYLKSKLTGAYNLENILAAARIGVYFKVDPIKIQEAIEEYTPSNNRSQVNTIGTNTLIVDCYNANPSSMKAALDNFFQIKHLNKIVILGDMLELGSDTLTEHNKTVASLKNNAIQQVFLVGEHFLSTPPVTGFNYFKNVTDLNLFLKNLLLQNSIVLIKGSRGIQLEKVVEQFH